jgi:hypothetical protein
MRKRIIAAVLGLALGLPVVAQFSACAGEVVYRDSYGRPYHSRVYREETIYEREPGVWYARRTGGWVRIIVD